MEAEKRPLVSVVVPVYNAEKTLAETVKSIFEQSYPVWELLLIDDCSNDGSFALAQDFAKQDERIRVFENEKNAGVGFTRNRGVQLAKGDWIAFLDSDDLWAPEKLEKQLTLLAPYPDAALLFTGSAFIRSDGTPIDYVLHVPERIDRKELLKQNLISCSSVLARKDCLLKAPFPLMKELHEDFAVWLRILEEESCAYGVDEPLLIYRRSDSSKSGNKWKAAQMNWRTYRISGLNVFTSAYYMIWYTIRGLIKYSKL